MKALLIAIALLAIVVVSGARATPSSAFWTNCMIDIQPPGITRLDVDNFFTFGAASGADFFATDFGALWGFRLSPKLSAEFGFDVQSSPATAPIFFNAKVGYLENTLSPNAPALQLGVYGIGTEHNGTNRKLNIIQLITGKTMPDGRCRVMASGYYGNPGALRSSTGERENVGFIVAFDWKIVPSKWVLTADYASGRNLIGGGGAAINYFFTPCISVETGPVWFNDRGLNGSPKMSIQFDINF